MRIGLVGYFGWGNYGDELFLEVYKRAFAGHELIFFHTAEPAGLKSDVEDLVDSVDAIVIGGGDLLIPWYKSWLYWDERFLKKPVFIFGIGVPTWGKINTEVMEHYRRFLSHPNVRLIGLRDAESLAWVQKNLLAEGPFGFWPDMVLALDFPVQQPDSNRVGFVLRHQNTYVTEPLYRAAEVVAAANKDLALIFLSTGRSKNDDLEVMRHFDFPNIDLIHRDSLQGQSNAIASCSHLVSMKFHGVVASYKCRVPFISLSGADKFKSFCMQTHNEAYSSNWADPALPAKLEKLFADGGDFSNQDDLVNEARKGVEALRSAVIGVKNNAQE